MPTVLYRRGPMDRDELAAAQASFPCTDTIVGIPNELVVGRYRPLPFYEEFVRDLAAQGSRPVNSAREHAFIASFDWYEVLKDLTPMTWFQLHQVPKDGGPYVVKGITNSKKEQWSTAMYAPTFADAVRIAGIVQQDRYLADQPVIVRAFEPLRVLEVGINGLPFANEWRCFAYRGEILARGFYWSGASDDAKAEASFPTAAKVLAEHAALRLAEQAPFTAIDIAETADGRWIVIEVNDGQTAGLSDVDPRDLYPALARALVRAGEAV